MDEALRETDRVHQTRFFVTAEVFCGAVGTLAAGLKSPPGAEAARNQRSLLKGEINIIEHRVDGKEDAIDTLNGIGAKDDPTDTAISLLQESIVLDQTGIQTLTAQRDAIHTPYNFNQAHGAVGLASGLLVGALLTAGMYRMSWRRPERKA